MEVKFLVPDFQIDFRRISSRSSPNYPFRIHSQIFWSPILTALHTDSREHFPVLGFTLMPGPLVNTVTALYTDSREQFPSPGIHPHARTTSHQSTCIYFLPGSFSIRIHAFVSLTIILPYSFPDFLILLSVSVSGSRNLLSLSFIPSSILLPSFCFAMTELILTMDIWSIKLFSNLTFFTSYDVSHFSSVDRHHRKCYHVRLFHSIEMDTRV